MKFSVLLPTRNRIDLLRYAIESVRRQDYSDWEIVVSDNASEEDVRGYVTSLGDSRIRYVRTESFVPVTENWNNVLRHASGDYVLMLGDDDAIMGGYFRELAACIEQHDGPDVIYTDAYQFAYPNVIPGHATAFIQRGYTEFLRGNFAAEPFWLDKVKAKELVRKSMSFRVAFGFNMQHYLVSRKMVREISRAGDFYQSPYPDYYAANALLLEASRILVVPHPLVVIGISPKSFGYYYFNDKESEGDTFLNNVPEPDIRRRLERIVLPGSSMNSSWLYAMEAVKRNFDRNGRMAISYRRYRFFQIYAVYVRSGIAGVRRLLPKLSVVELLVCFMLGIVMALSKIIPLKKVRQTFWTGIFDLVGPHPRFDLKIREVPYRNILEMIQSEGNRGVTVSAPSHEAGCAGTRMS